MTDQNPNPLRRQLLRAAPGLALGLTSLNGQPAARKSAGPEWVIAQLYDNSQAQQDVARDFLTGAQTAWQTINAKGGLMGRRVRHLSLAVDGSTAAIESALASAAAEPDCLLLSGCVGHGVALAVSQALVRYPDMAQVAPWLQTAAVETDHQTIPVFATRNEQVAFALQQLSAMHVSEVAVVYATASDQRQFGRELERNADDLKLKLRPLPVSENLIGQAQTLPADLSPVLLFVGGTPELIQFRRGLLRQTRRYILIAMADVNAQTVRQMEGEHMHPLIITQVVPSTGSPLPIVRQYRESLAQLFDEAPSALSLAGYLAAQYTAAVLQTLPQPLTRRAVLAAFQKSPTVDLGGVRLGSSNAHRAFVTQTMLTENGRQVD